MSTRQVISALAIKPKLSEPPIFKFDPIITGIPESTPAEILPYRIVKPLYMSQVQHLYPTLPAPYEVVEDRQSGTYRIEIVMPQPLERYIPETIPLRPLYPSRFVPIEPVPIPIEAPSPILIQAPGPIMSVEPPGPPRSTKSPIKIPLPRSPNIIK